MGLWRGQQGRGAGRDIDRHGSYQYTCRRAPVVHHVVHPEALPVRGLAGRTHMCKRYLSGGFSTPANIILNLQLLQVGFCVLVVIGVSFGLGAHVDNVPEENRHKALIFKWAGQVAYIVVSTLVKFVVGIFLLRLCVNDSRWQRITIIVLLIVVGLFNIFYFFLAVFQCQPIAFYWYRYTPDAPVTGKCNGHALATVPTYFAVLIGIVADITLALLPVTLIKGANLDRKTKISVCCVLALGSLYESPSSRFSRCDSCVSAAMLTPIQGIGSNDC